MRILLVDDEQRLRSAIARSLGARGHEVSEAGDARMALALADSQQFDLLVLDVNLPDATGWDVLRSLKEQGIVVRTVVFSAAPPSRTRIGEFAPFGVLYKPFHIGALLSLVDRAAGTEQPIGDGAF